MNGLPYLCTAYTAIGTILTGYALTMTWRLRRARRLNRQRRQEGEQQA